MITAKQMTQAQELLAQREALRAERALFTSDAVQHVKFCDAMGKELLVASRDVTPFFDAGLNLVLHGIDQAIAKIEATLIAMDVSTEEE